MLQRKSEHKNKGEKGVAIILATFAILMLGGMIGLAIDGGIAFFLKARLGQAMDAASLAGARSLARGVDVDAQKASAIAVAKNYFSANFPNSFWGCTVNTPTVNVWEDTVNTHIRYVQVTGTVTTPLYFMRVLGFTTASLASTATAQRRDVNVMLVLDRSGSMSGAIDDLVKDATWFVGLFASKRDKVGLLTFGGSYYMIKPSVDFATESPATVAAAIKTLNSGNVYGTTNHAQPLWVAYKALAEINEPGSLNVMVFFTDGEPNTIFADWQPYLANRAGCNNGGAGNANPVLGYALVYSGGTTQGGLFASTLASPLPPYGPGDSLSPATVQTAYINTAYDYKTYEATVKTPMANHGSCSFWSNVQNVSNDFTQIPPLDYYGNATNPAKTAPSDCPGCNKQYKSVTLTNFTPANLTAAAFNAGDTAAQRMRAGVINNIIPLVDCIALSTTSVIDSVYMNRLANTTSSTMPYDKNKPTGLYVYASTTADLQPAFQQIASQILHLSQ